MSATTFDTHGFIKELESADFTEKQAEAIVNLQQHILGSTRPVTEEYFNYKLSAELREMELRMTVRLGSVIAISMTLLAALIKLL